MARGSQAAISGVGKLVCGMAISATPIKPHNKPSKRSGCKRSMPKAKAMGSESIGMVEIRIDITPLGKCATEM